jgi:hypothetical protein
LISRGWVQNPLFSASGVQAKAVSLLGLLVNINSRPRW